jgi:hypothetical protein
MKSHKLSDDLIKERLESTKSILIGPYLGNSKKTLFRCQEGHETMRLPAHVFRGINCAVCKKNAKLSRDIINQLIVATGNIMIGDYLGSHIKTKFRCVLGHEWNTMPHSVYYQNKGCPICNTGTFSSEIPAYAYVLKFETFIKYGITANLPRRLEQHLINGKYSVVKTKLFDKGIEAFDWEYSIKTQYGGRFVSKKQCPDGYTETLPITLLEKIVSTL